MEERADIFYQFFQELIESYRHDILQREDAKELAEKEIGAWNRIRERFGGPRSEEYKLISELTGCILDISCIKPVSYTHLDVYKRQTVYCVTRNVVKRDDYFFIWCIMRDKVNE